MLHIYDIILFLVYRCGFYSEGSKAIRSWILNQHSRKPGLFIFFIDKTSCLRGVAESQIPHVFTPYELNDHKISGCGNGKKNGKQQDIHISAVPGINSRDQP